MAEQWYLASTLVMGLLVLGVALLVVRGRGWRQYTPETRPRSAVSRAVNGTGTWTLAFILLVVGFFAGAIVALSGGIPETGIIVALLVALLAYLVSGVYFAMRSNGRPSAQAAAGSAIVLGLLFVVGISVKLVLGL